MILLRKLRFFLYLILICHPSARAKWRTGFILVLKILKNKIFFKHFWKTLLCPHLSKVFIKIEIFALICTQWLWCRGLACQVTQETDWSISGSSQLVCLLKTWRSSPFCHCLACQAITVACSLGFLFKICKIIFVCWNH